MASSSKYDPRKKLVHRIERSEGFDADNVLAFMVEARKLMEIKSYKSKYPHLKLYCDWCLHSELGHSDTIYEILERITGSFLQASGLNDRFIEEVNKILSMDNLRKQMLELFALESIPDDWISINYNWYGFRQRLLSNIVRVPIKFPESIDSEVEKLTVGKKLSKYAKERAKIYLRIQQKSRGLGAVSLVLDDEVQGKPKGDVWWEVEISLNRKIRSRLFYYDPKL